MPARIRRVAAFAAMLLMVAAPTSAETQDVVMTAPYASDDWRTTCGETGLCDNGATADRASGRLAVSVEVAGAHGELGQGEYPTSTAEAQLTASHAIPDLSDSDQVVESISYRFNLTRHEVFLAAFVGRIEFWANATHSTAVELDGADKRSLYYGGGTVIDPDEQDLTFTLEVTGLDGAPIPPGDMDVTFGLDAILGGAHAVHCEGVGGTCVTAGGAAGILDTAVDVNQVVATITTGSA